MCLSGLTEVPGTWSSKRKTRNKSQEQCTVSSVRMKPAMQLFAALPAPSKELGLKIREKLLQQGVKAPKCCWSFTTLPLSSTEKWIPCQFGIRAHWQHRSISDWFILASPVCCAQLQSAPGLCFGKGADGLQGVLTCEMEQAQTSKSPENKELFWWWKDSLEFIFPAAMYPLHSAKKPE